MFIKIRKHLKPIGIAAMCVAVICFGAIYYYGIHMAFVPNAEDIATTWNWNMIVNHSAPYEHRNVIFDFWAYISVKIGGMSYFSIRFQFTMMYTCVLIFSLLLALKDKSGKINVCFIPLFSMFMIFLHTVREGELFAQTYEEIDLIYQYPYDYHLTEVIFSLIGVFLICCILTTKSATAKKIYQVLFGVVLLYALFSTDLIYYVSFLMPFFITLFFRGIHNQRYRKYWFGMILVGIGGLLITRILPFDICEKLWTHQKVGIYDSIYGATNFLNIDRLMNNIVSYIKMVLLLFNIKLSEHPIISFWTVIYVIKLILLLMGYLIAFRVIKGSITGKKKDGTYDIVDEILAWGICVLMLIWIMSEIGYYKKSIRYVTATAPFMTILLCRNIKGILYELYADVISEMKYKKALFFAITGAICICFAEPVWLYKASDSYEEDCIAAIEYVEQTKLGYAVAPYWIYPRLTAMTEGEIIFYPTEEVLKEYEGDKAQMTYLITTWDFDNFSHQILNLANVFSYEELCEKYGTPSRVLELDSFGVCVFENRER